MGQTGHLVQGNKIQLVFIQPCNPTQNAYIDRLSGFLRKELLNAYVFRSITDVCKQVAKWIDDYNFQRTHESLENKTPVEMANHILENSNFEWPEK